MLDQVLGGNAGHDAVSIVDAPAAVMPERVGQRIGDVGRVGGTESRCVCHAATVVGTSRTDQEPSALGWGGAEDHGHMRAIRAPPARIDPVTEPARGVHPAKSARCESAEGAAVPTKWKFAAKRLI